MTAVFTSYNTADVERLLATLPEMTHANGALLLRPAAFYDQLDRDALRLWCHVNARYGLPTLETVGWLQMKIAGREAIEIGSGHGDLAWHLGVRATDSKVQLMLGAAYALLGQPTIDYPKWVEHIPAAEAIAKYQPEVVVGSWVSQRVYETDPIDTPGFAYGVEEREIVQSGVTYIVVGNEAIHGKKRILEYPHSVYELPFLRSRASQPQLDRIWIWND